jgi:hypothetical protein
LQGQPGRAIEVTLPSCPLSIPRKETSMRACSIKVKLVNYDEMLDSGSAVMKAGILLGLPHYLIELWVLSYLRENIKYQVIF